MIDSKSSPEQGTTTVELIHSIVSIDDKRVFTLKEAKDLLPLVYRITEEANKEVARHVNRIDAMNGSNPALVSEIKMQIEQVSEVWRKKLVRLGVHPKGIWLADFDNGEGYYCWKFPENDIRFWHGYQDGYSGRIEIQ